MSTTSLSGLVRRYRWAAGAALGGVGLLLNIFHIALSPGIDWLFGGVAYLLAAVALGPGPGFLAAAVASLPTLWLWNHPYAWVIFSLEGLVVATLVGRWNRRPLTADALYWLLIGVPLILVAYLGIMGVGGTTLTVLALKQPLNGLINAIIVEALLLLPSVRRTLRISGAPRLRAALALVMLIASIVPALVFGVWAGRREWSRSVDLARDRVEFAAQTYASKLDQYVRLHEQSVRSLANAIESRPELDVERRDRLVKGEAEQFPGFRAMFVLDPSGTVLASHPPLAPDGLPTLAGLARLPFFAEAGQQRRTVVSDVLLLGGWREPPTVLVVHPLVIANTVAGFVLGALDLGALPAPVISAVHGERLRVLDRNGTLLFDSHAPYEAGDTLRRAPAADVFAHIRAADGPGVTEYGAPEAMAAPVRVATQALVGFAPLTSQGWWSWVDHPYEQIESAVAVPYVRLLALLVALIATAGVFSTLIAGWLAAPLLRLRWATAALAAGDRDARVRSLAPGVPTEIAELGRGFDEMAETLAGRAEELEELSEIARSLASTLESGALLRQITDATARLIEQDGCGIALLEEDRSALRAVEYCLGLLEPTSGRPIPLEGSLIGWVVRNERPARIAHVDAELRVYRSGVDLEGIGSVICAPLLGRSGPLGALTAVRAETHRTPFDDDDLQLLERLARTAAIAVENARLIEAAQAASRAKSDFIAAMSHELRTPLNAVLGHLQLLELELHGPITPEQREAMERIGSATRHLRGLIEEVLSFARLEAGRVELRYEQADLAALLDEVAAVIEPLAREKNLEFRIELDEASVPVRTDPDKVRQILINLAGNAVKFTERGEVRLSLEREGQPDTVSLKVADTGPGISDADRARLFQPFEQLESGLSRRHGGTGLGLYLSGQYAALIGGEIRVESSPGRGSVFTLLVPREPPEAEGAELGVLAGEPGEARGDVAAPQPTSGRA